MIRFCRKSSVWIIPAVLTWVITCTAYGQAPDLERMDIVLRSIPDGPVAHVGNVPISAQEFRELYLAQLTGAQRLGEIADIPDLMRINLAVQCLQLLVERHILMSEAQRLGIQVSDQEVEDAFKTLGQQLAPGRTEPLTEEEVLMLAGATRDEAIVELRRALILEKMRDKILKDKNIDVSDAEVLAFFNEHKEEFRRPETVHVHQIFVHAPRIGTGMIPTQSTRDDAKNRAEQALAKLMSGLSFKAVAESDSDPPFQAAGGDVGPMPLSALPPEVQQTIMTLSPGRLSHVIETDYGFHIVKLIEMIPGNDPSLEDVKPWIQQQLLAPKANEAIREFCGEADPDLYAIRVYLDLESRIRSRPELRELFEQLQPPEGAEW